MNSSMLSRTSGASSTIQMVMGILTRLCFGGMIVSIQMNVRGRGIQVERDGQGDFRALPWIAGGQKASVDGFQTLAHVGQAAPGALRFCIRLAVGGQTASVI